MRIMFTDFWKEFKIDKNAFTTALSLAGVHWTLDYYRPEVVIHSVFGNTHKRHHCPKILFTGEPSVTSINGDKCSTTIVSDFINEKVIESDYVVGFQRCDHPRYARFPLYAVSQIEYSMANIPMLVDKDRPNFCVFPVYNLNKVKKEVLDTMHKAGYKVDVSINNGTRDYLKSSREGAVDIPWWDPYISRIVGKLHTLRNYKFALAIENCRIDGYVTEKILDCFMAGCVPIYSGHCSVVEDIDPKLFVQYTEDVVELKKRIEAMAERNANSGVTTNLYKAFKIPTHKFMQNFTDLVNRALRTVANP